jgi:hypothetical protein
MPIGKVLLHQAQEKNVIPTRMHFWNKRYKLRKMAMRGEKRFSSFWAVSAR